MDIENNRLGSSRKDKADQKTRSRSGKTNINNTKNNVIESKGGNGESQNAKNLPWYPRVIVIGPGGIKGFKVLGFLSPIEDVGLLDHVDTLCGVSIGAVICLLLICGYKIREIIGEASKLDIFKELGDLNFNHIMENKGIISNEPIRKILTQLVISKFGTVPSLRRLYMMTGRSFVTSTLNVTDGKWEMMNFNTYPNVSCVDATMFSMNIPFVFYQLMYHDKTYVDGALANPYPVDYFDDGDTNILGIYMETSTVKRTVNSSLHIPNTIMEKLEAQLTILSYCSKIAHSLIDHRRNHIIQNSSQHCKHARLQTNISDVIGYNVTINDKAMMLTEGFNEGKNFISCLMNNTYESPEIPDELVYRYPKYYMSPDGETTDDHINTRVS